jgi:hypothetical protein
MSAAFASPMNIELGTPPLPGACRFAGIEPTLSLAVSLLDAFCSLFTGTLLTTSALLLT